MGFRVAQPALLYLVPCTLGPVCFAGWRNGELSDLWEGISHSQIPEDDRERGEDDESMSSLVVANEDEERAMMVREVEANLAKASAPTGFSPVGADGADVDNV